MTDELNENAGARSAGTEPATPSVQPITLRAWLEGVEDANLGDAIAIVRHGQIVSTHSFAEARRMLGDVGLRMLHGPSHDGEYGGVPPVVPPASSPVLPPTP